MESLTDQARRILEGRSLKEKLAPVEQFDWKTKSIHIPKKPGRHQKIAFSNETKKFPKDFSRDENKAFAIHSFANHELLAIEIMAYALLLFPHRTDEECQVKKAIISSLHDEQEHFRLYQGRLHQLGYEFGDFPVNDFFWKHVEKIKTPAHYFSMMSLTFEAANLDFAAYFKKKFKEVDDKKSEQIMHTVFVDEISHVKTGVHFIEKWRGNKNVWEYYVENLLFPLTPARSKGIEFTEEFRARAGLGVEFIQMLNDYDDGFEVTKRSK